MHAALTSQIWGMLCTGALNPSCFRAAISPSICRQPCKPQMGSQGCTVTADTAGAAQAKAAPAPSALREHHSGQMAALEEVSRQRSASLAG